VRDIGNTHAEQGSPQVSPAQTPHLSRVKAQLLPHLAPNRPHQPKEHLPRRLFLKGRFLPNKSPNRDLQRVNLSSQAPRKLKMPHPPLQNWLNFFNEGWYGVKL